MTVKASLSTQESLLLLISISWAFFPIMLKPISPELLVPLFLGLFLLISTFVVWRDHPNKLIFPRPILFIGVFYSGYLVSLLVATLASDSSDGLMQFLIVVGKFLFFLLLLFYLRPPYIQKSMDIYSNLMVVVSALALISFLYVELGGEPIFVIDLFNIPTDVYLGAFSPQAAPPMFYKAARLQGLTDQPATFAYILIPAYFWLLLVRKSLTRLLVMGLALVLTMSIGAFVFLFLVLLIFIIFKRFTTGSSVVLAILILMSLICMTQTISHFYTQGRMQATQGDIRMGSMTTTWPGKTNSFKDRVSGTKQALNYLNENPIGAGASLGMPAVGTVTVVGYLSAATDSGVVGGALYLLAFGMIGYLALMYISRLNTLHIEGRKDLVISISVLSMLIMGTQKMQPDISFWNMWLFALFFHLQGKTGVGYQSNLGIK